MTLWPRHNINAFQPNNSEKIRKNITELLDAKNLNAHEKLFRGVTWKDISSPISVDYQGCQLCYSYKQIGDCKVDLKKTGSLKTKSPRTEDQNGARVTHDYDDYLECQENDECSDNFL